MDSLKGKFKRLETRNLTFAGKIQILISLSQSKAVYVCTIKNAPQKLIDVLNHFQKKSVCEVVLSQK